MKKIDSNKGGKKTNENQKKEWLEDSGNNHSTIVMPSTRSGYNRSMVLSKASSHRYFEHGSRYHH